MFAVLLCLSVNRHSIFILVIFIFTEIAFHIPWSDFWFYTSISTAFSISAINLKNIKYELQQALSVYSTLYWLAGLDFLLSEQETVFYVIFPYAIKLIDIYVIYHLINKEQRNVGIHSASHCTFN